MKILKKDEFLGLCSIIKKLDYTDKVIGDKSDYMTFAIADCLQYSYENGGIFYNVIDDLVGHIFKSFGIEIEFLIDEDYELFYNLCDPNYENKTNTIYDELMLRSKRKSIRNFIFKNGKISDDIYLPFSKLYEEYKKFTIELGNIPLSHEEFMKMYDEEIEVFKFHQGELKYLKDLADKEMINRFTTAEIKVEMTHHRDGELK